MLVSTQQLQTENASRVDAHEAQTLSQRVADAVTKFVGSWWFLLVHVLWWGPWLVFQIEPFPFGLLTMILSLEAIVLTTLVMISQNRQADRDRQMASRDDEEISQLLALQQDQMPSHKFQGEALTKIMAKLGIDA